MKKMIYTLGLIGLISGVANAADNYTCATPPSCASLGYTLTSTTDCIGTPLKCPFDPSRYYCAKKSEVFSNMALNWNAKVSFSAKTYYYPNKYGFIVAVLRDVGAGTVYLKINGINYIGSGHERDPQFYTIPVKPGDSVYATSYGHSEDKLYFVPFAGN